MVLNNIAGHMNLLPADTNFRIGFYCSLASLNAYSRTCKDVRNSCGMLKLNELYTCALQEFLKLQDRFILKCRYSEIPGIVQNVLTVKLKDYKLGIEANTSLEILPHSEKKFEATVGFVIERNHCFALEDMTDILPDLKEDQFFIAVRLGGAKETEVKVPKNTNLISRLYFR